MSKPSFRVVIPARHASSRLPGKPLLLLAGRPLVLRVLDVARSAGVTDAIVATDDERIAKVVRDDGGDAMMTSPDHATGTDRLAEVADQRGFADDDVVVNLQGDEPFVPAPLLGLLASALAEHPEAGIATLATPIRTRDELFESSVVKTVLDRRGLALYFSRAPIPFYRGDFEAGATGSMPPEPRYLRHLGLYAYRARTLRTLREAEMSPAERAESLEQLRALDLGLRIHVSVIAEAPLRGIDTPEDFERAVGAVAR